MLPDGTIDAHRIWKRFRADRRPTTLRERVERPGRRKRGWRWALQDVDLRVEPGESVALIGTNGSGRSTLLKILTGVMDQYAGSRAVAGRVGALLELRTGIPPQLPAPHNARVYRPLTRLRPRQIDA